MENGQTWRGFLQEEFTQRLQSNSRYSLRAFARDLQLSPGELSELLNGKRSLSHKALKKITKNLSLSVSEAKQLAYLAYLESVGNDDEVKPEVTSLDVPQFSLVSEWYYFAILNSLHLDFPKPTLASISKRLGLKLFEVKMALEKLAQVGLIEKKGDRYVLNDKSVYSPSEVSSKDVRKFHKQMLQKAMVAIDFQPLEERHYEGISFPFDPSSLPKIKQELSEFMENLLEKHSKGKRKTEVYHLQCAFFRLTEKGEL